VHAGLRGDLRAIENVLDRYERHVAVDDESLRSCPRRTRRYFDVHRGGADAVKSAGRTTRSRLGCAGKAWLGSPV
jgi:hypothetical protein